MRIIGIDLYAVELRQTRPTVISGGRSIGVQDSTIVSIRTDEGVTGWGESCPWGPTYLPMTAGTVRAALSLIAPAVLGLDPRNVNRVNAVMSAVVCGQEPARHAIDVACWDVFSRSLGVPLVDVLGGRVTDRLRRAGFVHIDGDDAEEQLDALRAFDHPHFEMKATGRASDDARLVRRLVGALLPGERLKVDANGGWTVRDAVEVMDGIPPTVLFEQPCRSYGECRRLRERVPNPICLDEVVLGVDDLARAIVEGVADVANVKLARVGGLSTARAMVDVCVGLRTPVILQCVGGAELTSAAIAHLASTIPAELLLSVWDGTVMLETRTADGHECDAVSMRASNAPGLGVEPRLDVLGSPIASYSL